MKQIVASLLLAIASAAALGLTSHSATITFVAPTTNNDGSSITTPLTFNLYQGVQGQPLTQVQTGITASPVLVTTGLVPGQTMCWTLSAVENGIEGPQSVTPACALIPKPIPGAPTSVTVVIN